MAKTENPPPPPLHLMSPTSKEVSWELLPFFKVYKDGTFERLFKLPSIPPSLEKEDSNFGVSSKDIVISTTVSARVYLPKIPNKGYNKLPILVYFHGGGFIIGSSSSALCHVYMETLAFHAKVVIVSVEYRLAPEYPLPVAYDDSWDALKWVASHLSQESAEHEPWLSKHGDFDRVYLGGDSSGANIVHNVAMRTGSESLYGDMKILGAFLCHPFFWGSEPIGSESKHDHEDTMSYRTWKFVYPFAINGMDNPMINPFAIGAPSLAGLKCRKLLVCVASMDELRERGVHYYKEVKESGWGGELGLYEDEGEHLFHCMNLESDGAKKMLKRLASFLI